VNESYFALSSPAFMDKTYLKKLGVTTSERKGKRGFQLLRVDFFKSTSV
jgi:hypothetical protein